MAEKIEFDIKVGSNELSKALSDATNGSKKLGDTISTALGAFGGGLAIKAFDSLGRAIGGTTDFIFESIDAAAEQETALNKLAQSLRATGEFSQQAVEDFSDFASELQKASVFGDELVISQLAIAKSFNASNEEAKALVQAAANLSATLGGSLEENVFKLGKTLGGTVSRELARLIPEMTSLREEALRSGAAFDLVNQRFGGAAAAELQTYTGNTTALKNSFSDLQEEIGGFITGSSSINSLISIGTELFREITQGIVDYRNEQKRANGTLVETEGTLNSLSAKYASVRDEIEKYQATIDADKQKTLLGSLFSFDNAPLAKERVQALTLELKNLEAQIEKAAAQVSAQKEAKPSKISPSEQTAEELQRIKQLEAEKTFVVAQAELERQNVQLEAFNATIVNDVKRQEAELQRIIEFETQKKELEFQLAEEKAALIQDKAVSNAELAKIEKDRELEFTRIANKNIVDSEKLKFQNIQNQAFAFKRFEDKTNKERVQDLQSTFGQIATLSQSGNKTLSAIGKSAAVANATIDGYAAVQKALASAPPPVNYALAAAVGAATAANIAKINGVQFENGGIVGGIGGATNGPDNRVATIRDGELVLNAEQQKTLFNAINSGAIGGGDIVIQINSREIARAVRSEIKSGFKLA